MSNALYDPAREGFLNAEISWNVATIKASLVRGSFTASHKFVSDFTGAGGTLVSTVTLASKSITNGIANAAGVTFTAVAAGAAIPAVLIYQASAVGGGSDVASSAQRLICWIDTATGLPVTPDGLDITNAWDSGTYKIFKL